MNPDVTRILNILAQTAAQQPPQYPLQHPIHLPPPDPRLQHPSNLHHYRPESAAVAPTPAPPPPIDPKTIADWPTALKHVMNTLGKDEAVMAQVKKVRCACQSRTNERTSGLTGTCR